MFPSSSDLELSPHDVQTSSPVLPDPPPECDVMQVTAAKIAVIDDDSTNIKILRRLLELEGYREFVTTTDSRDGVEMVRQESPDLVLLDLMMPATSGLDILRELRAGGETKLMPVVILTASTDRDTRLEALQWGANDFLNKPIDHSELVPRIRNILLLKLHQDRLKDHSRELEQAVQRRTAQLEASRRDLVYSLARAAEYRDDNSGHHVLRVGKYARLLAEQLGLDDEYLVILEQAAQLHDVGKIGVPDDVLRKPGKLTESEFQLVQRHCGFGKRILQRMSPDEEAALQRHADIGSQILNVGRSPVLHMATRIALTHHEWWDGSGYPLGLQGEDIPLEGRITAVADVFDALSTKRCYKEAFPIEKCFAVMEEERESHFDPDVLDALKSKRAEIIETQLHYADES